MTGRRCPWGMVGLVGLAFALRLFRLDFQSLWRDEVDAIRFACVPLADLLHTFVRPGQNGPLYHLLLRPWLHMAGDGEFGLRFFSLIWGVLAVPLTFRLARRLFPSLPAVSWLAALLTATSPYLVWYSQEGKMYTLVVVWVLLSMDCYLAALERGGVGRWLAYVVLTGLAPYVHFITALMIPAQVPVFFALDRPCRRRWRPWLASLIALTLPYLPLLAWQLPLLLHPGDTGFRFVSLPEMVSSSLYSYSLGVVQHAPWWTLALFVGLLFAAGLLWRDRMVRPVSLVALLCWLLVPILGLFLVSLSRPLYTARYLIFVLPAYLLLLAGGMEALGRRSRMVPGLLAVALLALNGRGLWLQATTPLKADFRSATRYVMGRLSPGEMILFQIPYGHYSFDYYVQHGLPTAERPTAGQLPGHMAGSYRVFLPLLAGSGGEPYRWAEGLYTNAGMSADDLDRRMAEIVTGSRAVWLVATEVTLWDERELVQLWLEQHAVLTDQAHFVQVSVYHYEFQ